MNGVVNQFKEQLQAADLSKLVQTLDLQLVDARNRAKTRDKDRAALQSRVDKKAEPKILKQKAEHEALSHNRSCSTCRRGAYIGYKPQIATSRPLEVH
jgi:hypothetical protein